MRRVQYRNLGPSGLRVSTVGLGCNNFGRARTASESQEGTDVVISAALDERTQEGKVRYIGSSNLSGW